MQHLSWWQRAVFYQIYPRSFADGNGDGIGDFPGITARLDYLRDLGIDAIWLSPHYPSPFLDCGYDISDYTDVAPEYGSIHDFRTFLEAAHARGLRVIIDLVLNHSSDQHPWFRESRSSRDNPKRDWYVWRDGRGGPPNNWASIFGGSAWTYDQLTEQYYYHAFLKEQPDLNWRNPELRQAMWDMVRFWLDLGVDGFRLDAIGTIFEHPDMPDHTLPIATDALIDANALTPAEYRQLLFFQAQQPGVHELMQELRALVDSYPGERVLVGEDEDIAYYGNGVNELHLAFNFPLMRTERLTPAHIRANQRSRLAALPPGAWPCNTLGNHDSSRVWSRYGDGLHDEALARLSLALMLTLKGTPFLYNGEEIGMVDLILSERSQLRDMAALSHYRILTERLNTPIEEALRMVLRTTRDRCRTPMQWSNEPNAGFSPPDVAPWLPVHPNYRHGVNVADQDATPASLLSFYRRMLQLRRATPALVAGAYEELPLQHEYCFAFLRQIEQPAASCLVLLNFAPETQLLSLDLPGFQPHLCFSSDTRSDQPLALAELSLAPFEILIVELVVA